MPVATSIEELFSRATPRLQRIAWAQRVAPDAVDDDLVQETLLEAWKSLDHLREEERVAAWLDGICRKCLVLLGIVGRATLQCRTILPRRTVRMAAVFDEQGVKHYHEAAG